MGRFVPPAFMGFVGQISGVQLRDEYRTHTATITLLARRSTQRPGTRQWRRGADLQAAVANFVETEQLVVVDGSAVTASFVQVWGAVRWRGRCGGSRSAVVASLHASPGPPPTPAPAPAPQVRGSIPLLWAQTPCLKYKIPIRIAPANRCEPVFAVHARELVAGYQVGRCGRGGDAVQAGRQTPPLWALHRPASPPSAFRPCHSLPASHSTPPHTHTGVCGHQPGQPDGAGGRAVVRVRRCRVRARRPRARLPPRAL